MLIEQKSDQIAALLSQFKVDFTCLAELAFQYFGENQLAFFCKAPYTFACNLAHLLND